MAVELPSVPPPFCIVGRRRFGANRRGVVALLGIIGDDPGINRHAARYANNIFLPLGEHAGLAGHMLGGIELGWS